jgi:magnesium-transporting ATPase (P-type)
MSAFFALFIFSGICNSFNARTTRANPLANLRQNPLFLAIMAAVAAVQLFLLYFGGSLFRTAPLTVSELARVLAISATVIPADAIRKLCSKNKKQPV